MSKILSKSSDKSEVCAPLILIAENNALNRRLTCDLLKSKGYRILEVVCVKFLIESIRQNKPDLVLLDLSLPGLDVLNIVKHIRADSKLDSIPLVAVTNSTINDCEISAIQREYDEIVSKPISITLLINKIDCILAKVKKYTIR